MDKTLFGALTGASALVLLAGGASAATPLTSSVGGVQAARSFGELLEPVPDAIAVLRADDRRFEGAAGEGVQLAQYDGDGFRFRHHHHNHNSFRRFDEERPRGYGYGFRHHHHHHHHYRRYYGD